MWQRKTAENMIFENFCLLMSLGGGDFENRKRDPNEPKVTFLLIDNIIFGKYAPGAVPRSSALCLFHM